MIKNSMSSYKNHQWETWDFCVTTFLFTVLITMSCWLFFFPGELHFLLDNFWLFIVLSFFSPSVPSQIIINCHEIGDMMHWSRSRYKASEEAAQIFSPNQPLKFIFGNRYLGWKCFTTCTNSGFWFSTIKSISFVGIKLSLLGIKYNSLDYRKCVCRWIGNAVKRCTVNFTIPHIEKTTFKQGMCL